MLPIVSNDLGKTAIKELISLAALILGSEVLDFKEGITRAILGIPESWSWNRALLWSWKGG